MQTSQSLKFLLLQAPEMDGEQSYRAEVIADISDIDARDWDRLAGSDNPFVSHAFLNALEVSGCATAVTGWQAQHILIYESHNGPPIGAMPLYLKSHSYGEYVFDHGWANAYERAGKRYYPKMQSCVPFTPATGPRFLTGDSLERDQIITLLLNAAQQITETRGASSLHITFMDEASCKSAMACDMLERNDVQYHWQNNAYNSFDDFLDRLTSRKRKQIRKERKSALATGVEIKWICGEDISEQDWDDFFEFYIDTGSRKWGTPYLNREFFSIISKAMPEKIILMMAYKDECAVAGALNFIGSDVLYGRHWGCREDIKYLHFELCYYQAIDYAIKHGLKFVEAGAQGQHKIARGYSPSKTYSAHWLNDPEFQQAVSHFLEDERYHIELEIKALLRHTPYSNKDQ